MASETAALLERVAAATDDAERSRLLDEVVVLNLGIARSIALRYRNRGISLEDLEQVARLGLVKAARGFDVARRHDFLAYAVPTIRGEVRKHFRDSGWTVRPPRRIQELQGRIMGAATELTQTLGRSPRPSDLARHLDLPVEEIEEALAADGCFSPTSLDRPVGGEDSATLGELLPGLDDDDHASVDARVILGPAVRRLGERDRRILYLRYFNGWTQEEIARDIGVTQMHVSRLLTRIMTDLRASVLGSSTVE
ncbi:sigma-70 family RNA polymerase sigma factor [Nocardioides mesophilus]|uniref:Sigma-70 family RNA polymerase sigma factor n=1 Tax=Nocardioides mesophilus TaxID=433659 RepID=A0A7G9RHL3_9ACTN|nr:sigma-70 family RNA polymerase sigma factor [Nocardioides mesophilus]